MTETYIKDDRLEKITFCTPTTDDYSNVKSIWEDPETMAAIGGVFSISNDKYLKWLDSMTFRNKHKNCYFLIMLGELCLGEVSFHRFNNNLKTAELNIKIKSIYRKQGYGKKALDYILNIFFIEWDGNEMIDNIREGNNTGLAALKSYGFQERINDKNEKILFLNKKDFIKRAAV